MAAAGPAGGATGLGATRGAGGGAEDGVPAGTLTPAGRAGGGGGGGMPRPPLANLVSALNVTSCSTTSSALLSLSDIEPP